MTRLYRSSYSVSMSVFIQRSSTLSKRVWYEVVPVFIVIVVGIFRSLISSRGEWAFHFLRDKRRGRIPGGIPGIRVRIEISRKHATSSSNRN